MKVVSTAESCPGTMSDDLFFSGGSDSASVDDPSPVQSSGVSTPPSHAAGPSTRTREQPSRRPSASKAPQLPKKTPASQKSGENTLICNKCGKVYKMKWYFDKHVIAHGISDVTSQMPGAEKFDIISDDLIGGVLNKMSREPNLGSDAEMQSSVIKEMMDSKESSYILFKKDIMKPIVSCLSKPSILLPQNRYQEAQTYLNVYLNTDKNMDSLCDTLKNSILQDISSSVCRKLVFRMTLLLLEEVQIFIARELIGSCNVNESRSQPMTEEEISEFRSVLSKLVHSFFAKGCAKSPDSKMWRSLCNCLREMFVDTIVTSKEFLDKNLWYKTEDSDPNIKISSNAEEFFLFVEACTQPQEEPGQKMVMCSLDTIMDNILSNQGVMALWFNLSNNYFSDENSVYVMRLMVSAFREVSLKLEQRQRNLRDSGVISIPPRTNLKRL
ncbi:Zinc finger protein 652-A [Frankliniella fusca]|uniref:Zinc finger protein 652-A n=1 Tax=Frankliniella fusca TaxID=407009 RepID=A0AAE1LDU3_9NEOP|nr:Zinc finger protein 652-A [Frankliniella fusca]